MTHLLNWTIANIFCFSRFLITVTVFEWKFGKQCNVTEFFSTFFLKKNVKALVGTRRHKIKKIKFDASHEMNHCQHILLQSFFDNCYRFRAKIRKTMQCNGIFIHFQTNKHVMFFFSFFFGIYIIQMYFICFALCFYSIFLYAHTTRADDDGDDECHQWWL